jgi:hypothetical protein
MAEFKTDNGKKGVERVIRTATGYRMFVYNPENLEIHLLEDDGIEMIIGRGVEDKNGEPYIEVEFTKIKSDSAKKVLKTLLEDACKQKNIYVEEGESSHNPSNLCFHVSSNCLSDVFSCLLDVTLPSSHPLIPDMGRNFVNEQQKVRHGLEQSLLSAFGQDMYSRPIPSKRSKTDGSNLPRSEANRIARLVEYFRNGVPEMHNPTGSFA